MSVSDFDGNVKTLRVPLEANVPTSSIADQVSIAQDTLRLVANNAAGNAIEFGVSDDSLQVLLASAQTLTGQKTFTGGLITNTLDVGGSTVIDEIIDDDSFATASDTNIATAESIKAYVDSNITAQDLDTAGDSGTGSVDLDSQSLTIAGTANEIETVASGQSITIGLPDSVTITNGLMLGGEIQTGNNQALFFSNAADDAVLGMKADTSDRLTFRTGGNWDRMVIDDSGNVGVGINTPLAKLSTFVNGDNNFIDVVGGGAGGDSFIRLGGSASSTYAASDMDWGAGVQRAEQKYHIAYNAAGIGPSLGTNQLFTVDSGGDVGIGQTAPSFKLDVNGTGRFVGNLTAGGDVTLSTADSLINLTGSSSNGTVGMSGDALKLDSALGEIDFEFSGSKTATISSTALTMSAERTIITAASSGTRSGLRLPVGVNPSSPVDGDLWSLSDRLNYQSGGTTYLVALLTGSAFTGQLTGLLAPINHQFYYTIIGEVITITPAPTNASGTSNATTLTVTGVPAAVAPVSVPVTVMASVIDNGNQVDAKITISTSGVMTFKIWDGSTFNPAGFTNSGTKGFTELTSFSYKRL